MTVKRVLRSLEATHPELYEFQTLSSERHIELVTEFLAKEAEYLRTLKIMGVSLFESLFFFSKNEFDRFFFLHRMISPIYALSFHPSRTL